MCEILIGRQRQISAVLWPNLQYDKDPTTLGSSHQSLTSSLSHDLNFRLNRGKQVFIRERVVRGKMKCGSFSHLIGLFIALDRCTGRNPTVRNHVTCLQHDKSHLKISDTRGWNDKWFPTNKRAAVRSQNST